jgi:PAS domain S-box-containing protein
MTDMQSLGSTIGADGLMPHGFCLTWSPGLLSLHVLSDSLMVLSYYSIPITLAYFLRQRKDFPYPKLLGVFMLFIVACGTTHLFSIITIWQPVYWLDGIVKAITAVISVVAAVMMFWFVPLALRLRSPAQLEVEVEERKQAQNELQLVLDRLQVSETRYRSLIENSPFSIHEIDLEGRFQSMNRAGLNMLGLDEEKMVCGVPYLSAISEQDEGRIKLLMHDAHSGAASHFEFAAAKDAQLYLKSCFIPIKDADGKVVMLMGLTEDITAQKLAEQKLEDSYKKLQLLTSYLENVKEEERTRIARELHDEMGATLAALKMRVAWLASKLPPELTLLAEEVGLISEIISDGINTVRHIVNKLRPTLLEDVGIVAAIEDYVRQFRQNTKIECILVIPEEGLTLGTDQSSAIFRILQESLSNIAKHAQASKVNIFFTREGNSLSMVVEDNGIGFVNSPKEKAFGLIGIRERALMAGGESEISSVRGKGTRISVRVAAPLTSQTKRP